MGRSRDTDWLKDIRSVVIKLGTGILTDSNNQIDLGQIQNIASQAAYLRGLGLDVVIVSSGAVGAGMGALGFHERPTKLGELQACAALGQVRLMNAYEKAFSQFDIQIAQVLLTHEDLKHKDRHLNARNTLDSLIASDVIPIVNENDAVSFTELQFGDNDKLSALVACLIPVDLLVILTSAQGLIRHFGTESEEKIDLVEKISDEVKSLAGGTTSSTAKGGMKTKVQAGEIVMRSGIPLWIGPGRQSHVLEELFSGFSHGTLFVPGKRKLKSRKRWIAFYHSPGAAVWVDEGAEKAIRKHGKSLLVPGIKFVDGDFTKGDVIKICDLEGKEFARGIASYSLSDKSQDDWKNFRDALIHRDDLVLL